MEVVYLNMISEVKKIEEEAKLLEKSYDEKLLEMDRNADSRISEMRENIESDLEDFQMVEKQSREKKLDEMRATLLAETNQEKESLHNLFRSKKNELVDIVIEEVMKQYGNS